MIQSVFQYQYYVWNEEYTLLSVKYFKEYVELLIPGPPASECLATAY